MNPDSRQKLRQMLIRHEGLRLKPYKDTVGYLTIGVGRCLDVRGISQAEALYLLDNDVQDVYSKLMALTEWFKKLDEARQIAMCDMAFNLGVNGVLKFAQMCKALEAGDYEKAASEMLDSKWRKQVGDRAIELANIIKTGCI